MTSLLVKNIIHPPSKLVNIFLKKFVILLKFKKIYVIIYYTDNICVKILKGLFRNEQNKKKSSAAKKVAIFFIVIMIIEILAIVGVSRVFKNDDVTPSIAGYSVFLMDSTKMGDAVPKNSLVLAENVSPSKDKIGKAVLCENVPNIGTSVFWLQDVVAKGDNVDGVIYKVYQGSDSENIYEVKAKDVVGIATTNYVTAGKAIKFVTSYIGMAICIVIPLLLLAIIEIIIAIASHSSSRVYDNEYDDEDDEDDDTLEDFLNESVNFQTKNSDDDESDYDINFGADSDEIQRSDLCRRK